MRHFLLCLSVIVMVITVVSPAQAQTMLAGKDWVRLALVSQKKSKTQLVCRYARMGEVRRQLLKQEAVVVFRLPKTKAARSLACPRPSPGRTNLVTFTSNLRRHPTLGKLLVRLNVTNQGQ